MGIDGTATVTRLTRLDVDDFVIFYVLFRSYRDVEI